MKSILIAALLILSSLAYTQEIRPSEDRGVDYNKLSQRFVTSVKEAQIEQQFRSVPEVQECIKLHSVKESDLNAGTKEQIQKLVSDTQKKAADCVKEKMQSVDESKLIQLSKSLELDSFGIVKGQGSQEVINYFSSRLQKALYGVDENKKPVRLNEQNLVDQKVFFDLYETQVGKNILLEISRYCQSVFNPGATGNKFNAIESLNLNDLASFKNYTDVSSSTLPPPNPNDPDEEVNLYKKFMNEVAGTSSGAATDAATVKRRLGNIFNNCSGAIPLMCEMYEYCKCKHPADPAASTATGASGANNCGTKFSAGGGFVCPSEYTSTPQAAQLPGQSSCHVVARLRGYRTNLQALAKSKDQLKDMEDRDGLRVTVGKGNYDGRKAKEGDTIDDLTSLTSSDAEKISELQNNKKYREDADKLQADQCAATPESPDCYNFFYQKDESVNFANASIGFNAATSIEVERIKKIEGEDLKKYLESRGYLDLAEKLKNGLSEEDVVKAAIQRFETEREATFKEMSQAFERKQIVGTDQQKKDKVDQIKTEAKNESKEFQNLLLFNNVVSSYLNIKKRGADGKEEDAGINIKSLEREKKAYSQGEVQDEDSMKFFDTITTDESKVKAGENPIVDINFLDAILGNEDAKKKEEERKRANGG